MEVASKLSYGYDIMSLLTLRAGKIIGGYNRNDCFSGLGLIHPRP